MNAALLILASLALPPLQDEALTAQMKGIEEGINGGDPGALDRHIDVDALIDLTLEGVKANDAFKAGYRMGVKKNFSIGKSVVQALRGQPGYKFLRLHDEAGQKRALFRLLIGTDFNYHDLRLRAEPGGGAKIEDLYVFVSGEWMSDTLRRMCQSAIASEPGALGKLVGKENEYVASMPRLQAMARHLQQGEPAETLRIYAGLPASVRKEKCALVVRIQAAAAVSGEEWNRAFADLKKHYPGDPCIGFHSLGPLVAAKKYDEALQAIDDLDRIVGGDAYLHYQRAEVHFAAADLEKAKAAARKSIEMEKSLPEGYWVLVTVSLQEKKFDETAGWLTSIERSLGLTLGDLTKVDLYGEFVKSPEYREWMKSRKEE